VSQGVNAPADIVCPLRLFRELLWAVHRGGRATVRVGAHACAGGTRWLLRSPAEATPQEDEGEPRFLVVRDDDPLLTTGSKPSPPHVGILALGRGENDARIWARVPGTGGLVPARRLILPGPGMHAVPLAGLTAVSTVSDEDLETWSRTIGALGGADVWQRLRRLRMAVVGCGRTGSLMAESLARLGVEELLLVDHDRLERANLGEMALVGAGDVGDLKALALARHLEAVAPGTRLTAITDAITKPSVLAQASTADVLVACVDNDAARLSVGILGAVYHRIVLDVGTAVPRTLSEGGETARADVRLVLPDHEGCLLCCGGLSHHGQAVRELQRGAPTAPLPGRLEDGRRGSLRSLNMLAVALAVQLLQTAVADPATGSRWAHVRIGGGGELSVTYPRTGSAPECRLCARAGSGDAAGLARA
jgi:hypothetical protein